MGGVEIVTVDGKGAMKDFIEFQYTLYKDDPYFVPQPRIAVKDLLHREKHPFYKNADMELFLARKDGKIVGRIAAIFDRAHNRFHEEKAGFFGFFECMTIRTPSRRAAGAGAAMDARAAAPPSCADP